MASIAMVGDRESGLYEPFCDAADMGVDLAVRNRADRKTAEGNNPYEQLQSAACCGEHTISLMGDIRKQTVKRTAKLEARFKEATLLKPQNKKDDRRRRQNLWTVEAKESGNGKGICWRLLATHEPKDYADAVQTMEWYGMRWYMEEVFRLLKNKGYKIEDSQIGRCAN
ncbi:MAG: hypothetical protein QM642_04000 [Edaphocola sp.]